MDDWRKSKTVWVCIFLVALAVLVQFNIKIPINTEALQIILGAVGLFGLRDAIDKNKLNNSELVQR